MRCNKEILLVCAGVIVAFLVPGCSATNPFTSGADTTQTASVAPAVNVAPSGITSNAAFSVLITADKSTGYWSTNSISGPYTGFTSSASILINSGTVTLYTYGRNANGASSQTNVNVYSIVSGGVPPNVTLSQSGLSTNSAFILTLTASKANGYWSTNGINGPYTSFASTTTIYVSRTMTVHYFGYKAGDGSSVTNSQTYTVSFPSGLLLWSRLGSASEISSVAAGSAGSVTGDIQFEAAKHGNGVKRMDLDSYVSFPSTLIDQVKDRGTVEMWVKPKVSDTVPYAYGQIGLFNGSYGPGGNGWENDIVLNWRDAFSEGGFEAHFYFNGAVQASTLILKESTPWAPVAGQSYHIALVWDRSGIGSSSDKVRIYRDGAIVIATNASWGSGSRTFPRPVMIGGCGPDPQNYDRIVQDNIKIWNYAKTDFSDRFTE